MAERQLFLKYIEFVLRPILEYQDKGCYFKVGSYTNESQKTILAFIHQVLFPADNLQSDYISGTNHANTYMKCRLCQCDNVGNLAISALRDDDKTISAGIDGDIALRNYAKSLLNTKKRKNNLDYIRSQEICKCMNIKAGQQPLKNIIKWQIDRKILTFHGLYNPDYLHTVLKGVIENIISWIVEITYSIGKICNKYENSMSLLDDRIKTFPIAQSLRVGRSCRFGEGISSLFKTTGKASSTKGTGVMYGSIEAWKLLPLLFQLVWCLNEDIVPFEPFGQCCDVMNPKQRTPQYNWNVGKVMLNTIVTALDFHFSVSTKLVTISQIKSLTAVINNLKSQLALLWVMHKDFLQTALKALGTNTIEKRKLFKSFIPLFTGEKHHLLTHLPFYLIEYGIDQRFWDTNLTERFHKICCKELIERSNKKFDDSCKTNLVIFKKRQHSKQIANAMNSNSITVTDTVKEYETPPSKIYVVDAVLNHGYDSIRFNGFSIDFLSNRKRDIEESYSDFSFAVISNIIRCGWLYSMLQFGHSSCKTYQCDVDDFFKATYWQPLLQGSTDITLTLLKAVSFKEIDVDNENIQIQRKTCYINDFNCFCNNAYRIDAQNHGGKARTVTVCSFVEILVQDDETQFGEICAMIGCKNKKTGKYDNVYLLVSWLTPVKHTSGDHFPFPLYKYEYDKKNKHVLKMNLIDASCVVQPCFAIPYTGKGCQWLENNENIHGDEAVFLMDRRFYVLSKSYVRRDNDIEYENYFNHLQKLGNMNNIKSNNHRSDSIHTTGMQRTTHDEIRENILRNTPLVHSFQEMEVISKFTSNFEEQNIDELLHLIPKGIHDDDEEREDEEEVVEVVVGEEEDEDEEEGEE